MPDLPPSLVVSEAFAFGKIENYIRFTENRLSQSFDTCLRWTKHIAYSYEYEPEVSSLAILIPALHTLSVVANPTPQKRSVECTMFALLEPHTLLLGHQLAEENYVPGTTLVMPRINGHFDDCRVEQLILWAGNAPGKFIEHVTFEAPSKPLFLPPNSNF